ncbi:MAG: TIGR02206 family membrane protein [Fidelibacterota bacterium]
MFNTFGAQHLWTLLTIAIIQITVLVYVRSFATAKGKNGVRWLLALGLLGHEVLRNTYLVLDNNWDFQTKLPLHLCGLNLFLVAYILLSKDFRAFPLAYFWAIGAIHSILTPNIAYDFPSYYYVEFFFGHSLTILGVLFLMVTTPLRPTFKSLHFSLLISFLVMGVVGFFNWLFNTNYMYLCQAPEGDNLTGLFPTENYLLILIVVGIVHFYLFYLPYGIMDFVRHQKSLNPQ